MWMFLTGSYSKYAASCKVFFFSMWTQVLLFEKPMFQGECIEIEKTFTTLMKERKRKMKKWELRVLTAPGERDSVLSVHWRSEWPVSTFFYSTATLLDFVFLFWSQVWKDSQTINMSPNYCRSTHTLISWCFIAFSWIQQWFLLLFIYSWVGYSAPGFEGRQYLLEEGEYADFSDWGGLEDRFLSIRPVLAVCIRRLNQRVQD